MMQSGSYDKGSQYHHGNLQQSLLDVALKALETGRLTKLSLRSLARECGVSQTAPYRHFASKEHLLAVLAENGVEKLLKQLNAARQSNPKPLACLFEVMKVYLQFAAEHSAYFQLIFNARSIERSRFPSLQRTLHRIEAMFAEPISRLGGSLDLSSMAHCVWAQTHGLATLTSNGVTSIDMPQQIAALENYINQLKASLHDNASGQKTATPEVEA